MARLAAGVVGLCGGMYGGYHYLTTSPSKYVVERTFTNEPAFKRWLKEEYRSKDIPYTACDARTPLYHLLESKISLLEYNVYYDQVLQLDAAAFTPKPAPIKISCPEFHTRETITDVMYNCMSDFNSIPLHSLERVGSIFLPNGTITVRYRQGLHSRYITPMTKMLNAMIEQIKRPRPPPSGSSAFMYRGPWMPATH